VTTENRCGYTRRSDPLTCSVATVEGTLAHRIPSCLRGLPGERESRSVRLVCRGLVPRPTNAPTTAGVLWMKGGGERRQRAMKRPHSTRETPTKRPRDRGHVLRSIQRPVHVSLVRIRCLDGSEQSGLPGCRAHGPATLPSRSGNPTKVGRTGTGGTGLDGKCAARRAPPLTKVGRVTRQKRKVVMAIVPARNTRARSSLPVRRGYVAEVVRQHPGLE